MFRSNIQTTTPDVITAGGGIPGGTNGVLYLNTTTKSLEIIMPTGERWVAAVEGTGLVFNKLVP